MLKFILISLLAVAVLSQNQHYEKTGDVLILTDQNFEIALREFPKLFIKFYAPWCGHCTHMQPAYEQAAKKLKEYNITVAQVDCTVHQNTKNRFRFIQGFPTLSLFKNGNVFFADYQGDRTVEALVNFAVENLQEKTFTSEAGNVYIDDGGVILLNDNNYQTAFNEFDVLFVDFYAPWCGHCQTLEPEWSSAAKYLRADDIILAKVDCTQSNSICSQNGINAYPTMKLFKNQQLHENQYNGEHSSQEIIEYAEKAVNSFTFRGPKGGQYLKENGVIVLNNNNFDQAIKEFDNLFVDFFAKWCGHCKKLAPEWKALSAVLAGSPVAVAKVDCVTDQVACSRVRIQGYPTLILFNNGVPQPEYQGNRGAFDMAEYARQHTVSPGIKISELKIEETIKADL